MYVGIVCLISELRKDCRQSHRKWVLVTTVRRVCRTRMAETFSSYAGQLWMYWIGSCAQPTNGGPPASDLGDGLTTPHHIRSNLLH